MRCTLCIFSSSLVSLVSRVSLFGASAHFTFWGLFSVYLSKQLRDNFRIKIVWMRWKPNRFDKDFYFVFYQHASRRAATNCRLNMQRTGLRLLTRNFFLFQIKTEIANRTEERTKSVTCQFCEWKLEAHQAHMHHLRHFDESLTE